MALVRWFQSHARDLPWRKTTDPYAIWISEIMLQQTQVKTVLPYWKRWMEALPGIKPLAEAPSGRLHKLWEGLGYYSRVRNLQKAAQMIMQQHGGAFPRRFEDVIALPGIGPYTAGAICSIAYNQPTPIVDGNVSRVFTRLFAIPGDARERQANSRIWALAKRGVESAAGLGRYVSRNGALLCSTFNQSLMELGATICTPRDPHCDVCPIVGHCRAHQKGAVSKYPALKSRPGTTALRYVAVLLERNGRYLVRQRPTGVVNAHLWEFPNVRLTSSDKLPEAARNLLGVQKAEFSLAATVKHTITRYRITLSILQVKTMEEPRVKGSWLNLEELHELPFCSAHKRVLRTLSGGFARSEHSNFSY